MAKIANADQVRIVGLKELRAELKNTSNAIGPAVRLLNKSLAELVATDARARGSGMGGVFAAMAATIKAGATQTNGYVKMGAGSNSRGEPFDAYVMGVEFGSVVHHQFSAWRGSGADAGYIVFPTIRDNERKIREQAERAIEELLARVGA